MQKLTSLMLIILSWLQYSLWFGKNGIYDYLRIKKEVIELKKVNMAFRARNDNLFTEIDALNDGYEGIEELARTKLGMIKIGESFYRVINESSFLNLK